MSTKSAVIFFGLTGSSESKNGKGVPLDPGIAAWYNKQFLIEPNEADVFVHTWSTDFSEDLATLYSPIRLRAEEFEERQWLSALRGASLKWWLKLILNCFLERQTVKVELQRARNSWSRYLSMARAVGLVISHSTSSGARYGSVILTRLDVAHFTPHYLSAAKGQIVVSNWNNASWSSVSGLSIDYKNVNQHRGFLDHWFEFNYSDAQFVASAHKRFFEYDYNQHRLFFQHCKAGSMKVSFRRYRGRDYEMVRRFHFFSSE